MTEVRTRKKNEQGKKVEKREKLQWCMNDLKVKQRPQGGTRRRRMKCIEDGQLQLRGRKSIREERKKERGKGERLEGRKEGAKGGREGGRKTCEIRAKVRIRINQLLEQNDTLKGWFICLLLLSYSFHQQPFGWLNLYFQQFSWFSQEIFPGFVCSKLFQQHKGYLNWFSFDLKKGTMNEGRFWSDTFENLRQERKKEEISFHLLFFFWKKRKGTSE